MPTAADQLPTPLALALALPATKDEERSRYSAAADTTRPDHTYLSGISHAYLKKRET